MLTWRRAGGAPPLSLSLSLATLLAAWCCSEVIRYSLYAAKEAGLQPYALLWLRYTAFTVLYPLGVASELAMVALALPHLRAARPLYCVLSNAKLAAAGIAMPSWQDALVRYVAGL